MKFIKKIFNPVTDRHKDIWEGAILGFFSIAWFCIVATTVERIRVFDPITIIRILSIIVITGGVYVAIWKLINDQKWRRSEAYLEQAKELLQNSFDVLKLDDNGYPINDRYRWLSCARFLISAQELGTKLEDVSHKDTFDKYVEFWRFKFINLLQFDTVNSPGKNYFYEEGKRIVYTKNDREPISEVSVAVIYRFMTWPKNKKDPLREQSYFTEAEFKHIESFGPEGLHGFIEAARSSAKD